MLRFFRVRNFERFQHYTDRRPPWIKMYRDLWDDPRFFSLSTHDRYVLISLFVVASQHDNKVPNNPEWLKAKILTKGPIPLEKLIATGWLEWVEQDASEVLAVPAEEEIAWESRAVSQATRTRIMERCGSKCVLCQSTDNLEVDHIQPISQGGNGEDENLQILCRKCNRSKHSATSRMSKYVDPSAASAVLAESYTSRARVPRDRSTETETDVYVAHGEFGRCRLTESQHEKLKTRLNGLTEHYINRFDRWADEDPKATAKRKAYNTILNWYDADVKKGTIPAQQQARLQEDPAAVERERQRIFGKAK